MSRPLLAVSVGCPSGIGPEVSLLGAMQEKGRRVVLVGDHGVLLEAARLRALPAARLMPVSSPDEAARFAWKRGAIPVLQPVSPLLPTDRRPGRPSPRGGAAQLAWIDAACDLVSSGVADALVTGPVSKEAIARSGAKGSAKFLGHTEHLQRRLGSREVVMAFASDRLATSLVTTHLPLSRVPRAVTADGVSSATYWLAWLLHRLGKRRPTVAVASMNPHAGEGGLLGGEEKRAIAPGIVRARERARRQKLACELVGPVPAETAYRRAAAGAYDGVVAMYHDQATIPMKLLGFGEAVNVSLGLPIVRTSVDHGTGYDIAGRGVADPRGMLEAMKLAERLAAP